MTTFNLNKRLQLHLTQNIKKEQTMLKIILCQKLQNYNKHLN